MNNQQNTLTRLHEIVTKSTSGAIVLSSNPSQDAIAAATALYLGLIKMGKNVSLVCTQNVQSDLTGADKIQTNLVTGGDNLVVSFPYNDGAIDKVDYNIQGEFFNLIITPRQGYPKMDPNQVKYSYTGGLLDFIIVIDSPTLNNLGSIYSDNQNQFQGREIVNIDRHLTNAFYGTVNFVNKTASSISELILSVLQGLRIEIDKDIATNLYAGIAAATNNFTSYSVNAETFEHIATLLRMGALKKVMKKPDFGSVAQQPVQQQMKPNIFSQPKVPQSTFRNHPEAQQNVKPIESVEKEVQPEPQNPQDWLKPKIFKGTGLV
jgi:hypothetical protein